VRRHPDQPAAGLGEQLVDRPGAGGRGGRGAHQSTPARSVPVRTRRRVVDPVGVHPGQPRRVDVHAHRRLGVPVGHLVHVVRAEVAQPAGRQVGRWSRAGAGPAGGDHPLGQRAAGDGERAGRAAVVVQRRALAGQPGQQPDLGVGELGVQRRVEEPPLPSWHRQPGPLLPVLRRGGPAVVERPGASRRRARRWRTGPRGRPRCPRSRPARCPARSTDAVGLVACSVVIRSVASGSSSGCTEAHRCHCRPSCRITGSFTAAVSLPGSTVNGPADPRPSTVSASSRSTRQCLLPGVAQLT
jgi:hypothetical protein